MCINSNNNISLYILKDKRQTLRPSPNGQKLKFRMARIVYVYRHNFALFTKILIKKYFIVSLLLILFFGNLFASHLILSL